VLTACLQQPKTHTSHVTDYLQLKQAMIGSQPQACGGAASDEPSPKRHVHKQLEASWVDSTFLLGFLPDAQQKFLKLG
jgi:hypothetical protein